jgi:hypothetical protein
MILVRGPPLLFEAFIIYFEKVQPNPKQNFIISVRKQRNTLFCLLWQSFFISRSYSKRLEKYLARVPRIAILILYHA